MSTAVEEAADALLAHVALGARCAIVAPRWVDVTDMARAVCDRHPGAARFVDAVGYVTFPDDPARPAITCQSAAQRDLRHIRGRALDVIWMYIRPHVVLDSHARQEIEHCFLRAGKPPTYIFTDADSEHPY